MIASAQRICYLGQFKELCIVDRMHELKVLTSGLDPENVYEAYTNFALGDNIKEDTEEKQIKGVDVNEVVSMYEAQRQNRAEFTGYTVNEKINTNFNAQ